MSDQAPSHVVDDVHARLNRTHVRHVEHPGSPREIADLVRRVAARGGRVAVCGGRHAMGGQQFLTGGVLLDTDRLTGIEHLDTERGLVTVRAGTLWPDLIEDLARRQRGHSPGWGISQKQTGADRFSIGGSVSANCHGRGLTMGPMVDDVESLQVVDADGVVRTCSRTELPGLFSLVIGGYGLFGVVVSVTLRLRRRRVLERVVELRDIDEVAAAVSKRVADGFEYGDFQFAIDPTSPDLLRRGVFSCYRPVQGATEVGDEVQAALSREDWQALLLLAHGDKGAAFERYTGHYLSTSGQWYWSDLHQLADYVDGYHEALDPTHGPVGTEMIGELYVPRDRLADFMTAAAQDIRENGVDVVYGTVRFVEPDTTTFLPWARDRFACVVVNVHTDHTPEGEQHSAASFRRLIDLALDRGGSFYLTYHRWATHEQVLRAYPQMPDFLAAQRDHDPAGVFGSDWHTAMVELLGTDRVRRPQLSTSRQNG